MSKNTINTQPDGYASSDSYSDDELESSEELDLSFLDEEKEEKF